MPYLKGSATDFDDLIAQIVAWTTDATIHGDDAWELMISEPWPKGTILKAHGWDEGEHQYIGMMHQTFVVGQTYNAWYSQRSVIDSEVTFSNGHGGGIDQFYCNSQALLFNVAKQYSAGLDWHEQPGANQPPVKTIGGCKTNYPGVGLPAIGCDYGGFLDETAKFWVTKDRNRMVIVLDNSGHWEMMHVGFLQPFHKPYEYPFPACIVGSNSGVRPLARLVWPPGAHCPGLEVGYQFDYSLDNWFLSHANPTFSATYWDGSGSDWLNDDAVSQSQVMTPDGTWQSFSNWAIRKQVMVLPSCGGGCPSYLFANMEPERPAALRNYIRPTITDLSNTMNVYRPEEPIKRTYQLEPLEFVQNNAHKNENNMLGSLWRVYWTSSKVLIFGEQLIDDKLHLVIPSNWENRKWHLPHGYTMMVDDGALLATQRKIDKLSDTMNCVIRLED